MFKRFQKIIQTGVFRKADGLGEFEFGKTVVFYGLNTYGKTTLKDIFNSLAYNNPEYINKRKSIPSDDKLEQEVVLSYSNSADKEEKYKFSKDGWNCKDLQGKIFVFDNDFIHRNVITGFDITRDNKEALSDFILGEEGVKLSEEIRELKETVRIKKANLKTPPYFIKLSSDTDRERFVQLKVAEDKTTLEAFIAKKKQEISNYDNQVEITALPDIIIPKFELESQLNDIVARLNTEFAKDFKDVTKNTLEVINNHIAKCITVSNPQSWIKEGLQYKKGSDCPFCGQEIRGMAETLITVYNAYFNENYEKFVKEISQNLSSVMNIVDRLSVSVHAGFLQLQVQLQKYNKFDPDIKTDLSLDELKHLENKLNTELTAWKKIIKDEIEKKNKAPHAVLSTIELGDNIKSSISTFLSEFKNQKTKVETLIAKTSKFKNDYAPLTSAQIGSAKTSAIKDIKDTEEKITRLEQDEDCTEYLHQRDEIKKLEEDIKTKNQKLETQQSNYIDEYFSELEKVYSKLGSDDFKLGSTTNNRGNKKIYELEVLYKGVKIEHQDIARVMSESDKRSLAFAIFLTKLTYQTNKADLIILLDDPVVSFDDNRISVTVDIVKQLSNDFKQVFIFTHYPSLVKKLLETRTNAKYYKIHKNDQTSTFELLNTDNFVLSDYELAFEKIYSFIKHKRNDDISKDLRVYLERFLQVRFQKKIREKQITTFPLKNFINDLQAKDVITDQQKDQLHQFRESLNPDHHKYIGKSNEEDIRTYATDMLNFLSDL